MTSSARPTSWRSCTAPAWALWKRSCGPPRRPRKAEEARKLYDEHLARKAQQQELLERPLDPTRRGFQCMIEAIEATNLQQEAL